MRDLLLLSLAKREPDRRKLPLRDGSAILIYNAQQYRSSNLLVSTISFLQLAFTKLPPPTFPRLVPIGCATHFCKRMMPTPPSMAMVVP